MRDETLYVNDLVLIRDSCCSPETHNTITTVKAIHKLDHPVFQSWQCYECGKKFYYKFLYELNLPLSHGKRGIAGSFRHWLQKIHPPKQKANNGEERGDHSMTLHYHKPGKNRRKRIVAELKAQGSAARMADKPISACPYQFMDAYQWERSWNKADQELSQEKEPKE